MGEVTKVLYTSHHLMLCDRDSRAWGWATCDMATMVRAGVSRDDS